MKTCLVFTKAQGGTNLARAGHGKARVNASSMISEEVAAELAAAKYFRSQGLEIEKAAITCTPANPGTCGWNEWDARLHDFKGGTWSPWQPVAEGSDPICISIPCTRTTPTAP